MLPTFKKAFSQDNLLFFVSGILGPIFLAFSLCLGYLFSSSVWELGLLMVAFVGITEIYPKQGWKLGGALLLLDFLFRLLWASSSHFWELGLQSSLYLGIFVIQFFQQEGKYLVGDLKEKLQENQEALQEKKAYLSLQEKAWEEEKKRYVTKEEEITLQLQKLKQEYATIDSLRNILQKEHKLQLQQIQDLFLEKTKAQVEEARLQLQVEALEERLQVLKNKEELWKEKQELIQKLNELRTENYQIRLHLDTLQKEKTPLMPWTIAASSVEKMYNKDIATIAPPLSHTSTSKEAHFWKKKSEELTDLLKRIQKEVEELRSLEASHEQLKEQFEEKKKRLYQAKKEIFCLEGKLFLMQREKEERSFLFSEDFSLPQGAFTEELLQQCLEENELLYTWLKKLTEQS